LGKTDHFSKVSHYLARAEAIGTTYEGPKHEEDRGGGTLKDNDTIETTLQVRSYECDSFGHVNNAVYLNYLEYGRMAVLEKAGFTLAGLKQQGVYIVVRRIEIDYKVPAREGDRLIIRTRLQEHHKMKGIFYQEILSASKGAMVARAHVTWVFTDLDGKLIAIPRFFRDAVGF
jgi:acyl-CoA thioester hydrolase